MKNEKVYLDVMMETGKVLSGEKIRELVNFIINKFAEEELSRDESVQVLHELERILGETAIVQPVD